MNILGSRVIHSYVVNDKIDYLLISWPDSESFGKWCLEKCKKTFDATIIVYIAMCSILLRAQYALWVLGCCTGCPGSGSITEKRPANALSLTASTCTSSQLFFHWFASWFARPHGGAFMRYLAYIFFGNHSNACQKRAKVLLHNAPMWIRAKQKIEFF